MSQTRLQGLWQWAHIFLMLSILCSGFYAAILPVLLLLLPEPILVYCHETVFDLLLLAFQPIFLLDTMQHTSFCIHNCTSLKFPNSGCPELGVHIIRSVRSLFGADKQNICHIPYHLFKRLTVSLIHRKQEKRQHDKYHDERRCACSERIFEHKEKRYTDKCAASKADELPFC